MLDKTGIAKRIAKELKDGYFVNLGIGIPTLVANYIPNGIEVEFQSDGTLIDPNDAIIGGESNGVVFTVKTWSATNSVLSVSASAPVC